MEFERNVCLSCQHRCADAIHTSICNIIGMVTPDMSQCGNRIAKPLQLYTIHFEQNVLDEHFCIHGWFECIEDADAYGWDIVYNSSIFTEHDAVLSCCDGCVYAYDDHEDRDTACYRCNRRDKLIAHSNDTDMYIQFKDFKNKYSYLITAIDLLVNRNDVGDTIDAPTEFEAMRRFQEKHPEWEINDVFQQPLNV